MHWLYLSVTVVTLELSELYCKQNKVNKVPVDKMEEISHYDDNIHWSSDDDFDAD